MTGAEGLFPEPERKAVPATEEQTPGEQRRARQLAALTRGMHPLSLALGPLPLHPDARRDDDRIDDGSPRCGSCAHRRSHNPGHARSYPKCLHGGQPRRRTQADGRVYEWTEYPRATNGEGTDVAAWWPACITYEPKNDPAG